MKTKIYYEIQNNWTKDDYYYLHRYLHRMLFYYEKYSKEISSLDLKKMSTETKVLMFCIIKYYKYDFLLEKYENLSELVNVKPLKNKLVLEDSTGSENDIYKQMNVIY
ncbi:hypothetical protein [Eubacterium sp.]